MAKGMYPVIAILKYKDKNLNLELPLRVKKIVMTDWYCEATKHKLTLTKWLDEVNLCMENYPDDIKFSKEKHAVLPEHQHIPTRWSKRLRRQVPVQMLPTDSSTPISPYSLKPLIPEKVVSYKIYFTKGHRYIDVMSLLTDVLYHRRWRPNRFGAYSNSGAYGGACYVQQFEHIRQVLKHIAEPHPSAPKNAKIKVEYKNVTKEDLDKAYEEYELRKTARAI